jgi:hypothetical protein
MTKRPDAGAYDPELIRLMKAAFLVAWGKLPEQQRAPELARLLLAASIIDQVDDGVRDWERLAAGALAALAAARRLSVVK